MWIFVIFLRLLSYVTAEVDAAPLLLQRSVGSATPSVYHLALNKTNRMLQKPIDKGYGVVVLSFCPVMQQTLSFQFG
jgi:hypothetical protein